MTDYREIPLANCNANAYDQNAYYILPGTFMQRLRQMAYLLSSGEKVDVDQRRDMAQHIQAVMDTYKECKLEGMA